MVDYEMSLVKLELKDSGFRLRGRSVVEVSEPSIYIIEA